jgi:DhnA family fructose-bisphosphate aldolase class Ia
VFQHKNPKDMTIAISKVVHEGVSAKEAMAELK